MGDLSVKGILRKYKRRNTQFSLKDVLNITNTGTNSVRSLLESLAREEHSFHWEENCQNKIFGGDAKFLQIWTHIIVRIAFTFDTNVSRQMMDNLINRCGPVIQNAWSNKWGCALPGEGTCRFTFEVQWVSNNPHHTIHISICAPGTSCRENSGRWFDNTSGTTAAHEFGHLLGFKDEYMPLDPQECPIRNPVNTRTVMDNNNVNCFPPRLMKQFADNIGSEIVSIIEYDHDPSRCS